MRGKPKKVKLPKAVSPSPCEVPIKVQTDPCAKHEFPGETYVAAGVRISKEIPRCPDFNYCLEDEVREIVKSMSLEARLEMADKLERWVNQIRQSAEKMVAWEAVQQN